MLNGDIVRLNEESARTDILNEDVIVVSLRTVSRYVINEDLLIHIVMVIREIVLCKNVKVAIVEIYLDFIYVKRVSDATYQIGHGVSGALYLSKNRRVAHEVSARGVDIYLFTRLEVGRIESCGGSSHVLSCIVVEFGDV